jgi:hypothetical protein
VREQKRRVEREILSTKCAGLDAQKKTVKACLFTPTPQGQPHTAFRTSLTTTEDLLRLSDWLKDQEWTPLAFKATGVDGKPVFNLREGRLELLVVHTHHLKAVPGRKTEVKDAAWIADRLQHGLLTGSCGM